MANRLLALCTSNAALVRCELDRVRDQLSLEGDYASMSSWSDTQVLQRRYGRDVPREPVWEVPDTERLLLACGTLSGGRQLEESAQPYRYHHWLFGQVGVVDRHDAVRDRLFEQLPEFLQSVVRRPSFGAVVFGQFLAQLRSEGAIDDPNLRAVAVGQALQTVAKVVEQTSAEVGGTARIQLALMATNGRCTVATRRGSAHLSHVLLEGQIECRRCGLPKDAPEKDAIVRDHRRRRSVVLSTSPLAHEVTVPDGAYLAVERDLTVTVGQAPK